jgi:hypothetical protein
VLLEANIDDTLELIWLRPDLDNIWGYTSQNGFTTTSYDKYAQNGLSVFGSKQQQSIMARVLVEPSFSDLKQYNLIEAWVALSQHMVNLNLPYRAMGLAV